jgi:hypothetical protein
MYGMLSFFFSLLYFLTNMTLEHSHMVMAVVFFFFPLCDFFPYTFFETHIALEHRRFNFSGYGSVFFFFFFFVLAVFVFSH